MLAYIQATLAMPGPRIRCRCVLNAVDNGKWQLLTCAVEAFPDAARTPEPVCSRYYRDCVLHEEWFELDACLAFVASVEAGRVMFGDMEVLRSQPTSYWNLERVMLSNLYMPAAGLIVRTQFQRDVQLLREPLIAADAPYYPDGLEAAHDWIGDGGSSGYTDGRNGEVVFLLPESGAYFSALISDDGNLRIEIGGTNRNMEGLTVTGAYWVGGRIHHFSGRVESGAATTSVPDDVSRLECALIDDVGTIYDRYFEHLGRHSGLVRHRQIRDDDRLDELITAARRRGEGASVEFKPFIDPDEDLGKSQQKTKYRELVRTAVAFANANGGCVFLGIDDHCNITGVDHDFARIEQAAPSEVTLAGYCSSLLNKLCGDVQGEIDLRISPVTVQGRSIIVVEVEEAGCKPLMVRGEKPYYLRIGATNKQVPANEWADHLMPSAVQSIP